MRKHRNLFVENLENRALLAGNVAVNVSGGVLNITGDNMGNGVSVQELDSGKYWVAGFATNGANTTINGHGGGVVVNNVTQGMHIVLNNGYDTFVMSNSAWRRGDLAATLTGGTAGAIPASPVAPSAGINPVQTRVLGNFYLDAGAGRDGVGYGARVGTHDANGNTTAGTVHVIGGDGNDRVIGDRTEAFDDMLFDMGAGDDQVHADHARVGDFLYANLGDGHNTFTSNDAHGYHSQIFGGSGRDGVYVNEYHFIQEVVFSLGAGNNQIGANHVSGAQIGMWTGAGSDFVRVDNSKSYGDFNIGTGDGNDGVDLHNISVPNGRAAVYLGTGNDKLTVGGSNAHDAYFDGGAGDDTFVNDGGNTYGTFSKVNFEH